MPPRFVYGDSYGGVQAAEQGYDQQRDARYFNSMAIMDRRRQQAAQEAAQRAAMEDAAEARALSLFLNQSQMANQNRQFDLGSAQWERDFGLRSRMADESVAERTLAASRFDPQMKLEYDKLASAERQAAQRTSRSNPVLNAGLEDADLMPFPSVDAVMTHYQGQLSLPEAQLIFDRSQAIRKIQMEKFNLNHALSEASRRKAGVQAQISSSVAARPMIPLFFGPAKTLKRQVEGLRQEEGGIDQEIERLNLRLDYPQPVTANSAALPIPRTIIPVNGGPAAAPSTVPINGGASPYIPGRVYGGMRYLGGDWNSPVNWERVR